MTIRILVTGSRRWSNFGPIARALAPYYGSGAVVVHGAALGADTLAERCAQRLSLATEPHPADWGRCGPECPPDHLRRRPAGRPYCPTAGHRRNQLMVDLGADICLAFPVGSGWSGTRDCMARAEKAGIPIHDLSGAREALGPTREEKTP